MACDSKPFCEDRDEELTLALAMLYDMIQLYCSTRGTGKTIHEARDGLIEADTRVTQILGMYGLSMEHVRAAWRTVHAGSIAECRRRDEELTESLNQCGHCDWPLIMAGKCECMKRTYGASK